MLWYAEGNWTSKRRNMPYLVHPQWIAMSLIVQIHLLNPRIVILSGAYKLSFSNGYVNA